MRTTLTSVAVVVTAALAWTTAAHAEIKIGTLLSIIRQSGVARTHFESD